MHPTILNLKALNHLELLRKSEEIVKYLHDIAPDFSWEERKILEQAESVITAMINRKLNPNPPSNSEPII